jgi:hypothetical protein
MRFITYREETYFPYAVALEICIPTFEGLKLGLKRCWLASRDRHSVIRGISLGQ